MSECGESSSRLREVHIKAQRASNGTLLGACIALSADDIAFCDSSTEMLELQKKHVEDGIILEIRRAMP